jgi:hypothetical protein
MISLKKLDDIHSILGALTLTITLAQSCTPHWHYSFLAVTPIIRTPSLNDPSLGSLLTPLPTSLSLSLSRTILFFYIKVLPVAPEKLKKSDDQTVPYYHTNYT